MFNFIKNNVKSTIVKQKRAASKDNSIRYENIKSLLYENVTRHVKMRTNYLSFSSSSQPLISANYLLFGKFLFKGRYHQP